MSTPYYGHSYTFYLALLYFGFERIQFKKVLFFHLYEVFGYKLIKILNPFGGFDSESNIYTLPKFMASYFINLHSYTDVFDVDKDEIKKIALDSTMI